MQRKSNAPKVLFVVVGRRHSEARSICGGKTNTNAKRTSRERKERFQNKKKSEMKYDAKRPSLSPDSPLYSPREREIQKAPPPSSTHQSIIARTKKKTKKTKKKKKKNTKEYDTLNTSARKEPRFVVWVFLSLQFSSLKEERTLSRVCVSSFVLDRRKRRK